MKESENFATVKVVYHDKDGEKHIVSAGVCELCNKTWQEIRGCCSDCGEWFEYCCCEEPT